MSEYQTVLRKPVFKEIAIVVTENKLQYNSWDSNTCFIGKVWNECSDAFMY